MNIYEFILVVIMYKMLSWILSGFSFEKFHERMMFLNEEERWLNHIQTIEYISRSSVREKYEISEPTTKLTREEASFIFTDWLNNGPLFTFPYPFNRIKKVGVFNFVKTLFRQELYRP